MLKMISGQPWKKSQNPLLAKTGLLNRNPYHRNPTNSNCLRLSFFSTHTNLLHILSP